MTKLILIVEDDQNQRQILKFALNKAGFEVAGASSGAEALEILSSDAADRIDLVLMDMETEKISSHHILNHIKKTLPNLPVIFLIGHSNMDAAVEVMRQGAVDFISKPVEVDRLKVSIENAFRMNKLSGEVSRLSRKWSGHLGFDDLIGTSGVMKKAIILAKKGSNTNIPILLEGESGVGKEVFARAIQGESDRSGKPFIVVNCGAIPRNLVESILFGHEKGSFTGASDKHDGKFIEANGGTLFLDEIGELPLDLQVKLLRVLQEGEVDPVGSREPVKVDVRLISATNRRLKDMVETGEFREDLFYRLNIFPIELPPLRDRKEDIVRLAAHFVENICVSEGYAPKKISDCTMRLLRSYQWPGNVRQLANALYRAVILTEGDIITSAEFPQIPLNGDGKSDVQESPIQALTNEVERFQSNILLTALDENGDIRSLQDVEQEMISFAFTKYRGRISKMARHLGVGRSTLYRKITEYGLLSEET